MEYIVLRGQVKFAYSLLRCGWLWVEDKPLFTLGLLMFALSLVDFLSLLWNPVPTSRFFYFCQMHHLKDTHKIFQNFYVGLKFEWGSQDKYWLSWELLPFEIFFSCLYDVLLGVTYANMLVTTKWPLKRAPHLTSLVWVCVVWRSKRSLELAVLCIRQTLSPIDLAMSMGRLLYRWWFLSIAGNIWTVW